MSTEFIRSGLADMARTLEGSSILAIAAKVKALASQGHTITNLTIGDFDPKQFPLATALVEGTADALRAGHSNYPPASGIPELRAAVRGFYHTRAGIEVSDDRVLIAGGARPLVYAVYRALLNPGDRVIYSVPSWNNNHYTHLVGARPIEVEVGPEANFFPSVESLARHLQDAALIMVNSPLNPSGTAIDKAALSALCQAILAENARRKTERRRPLFLGYDQIYWMLTFGQTQHFDPISLHPEMADCTVYIDGISKCFAATGLRVGWSIGPAPVIEAMSKILGHIGAWAPKAEQVATAALLKDDAATGIAAAQVRDSAELRLRRLHDGIADLQRLGWPVRALDPQGTIYLSAEFALRGWSLGDRTLHTPADVRNFLLEDAGLAMVPFEAFGAHHTPDWYRLSVGAVGMAELDALFQRLGKALDRLQPAKAA